MNSSPSPIEGTPCRGADAVERRLSERLLSGASNTPGDFNDDHREEITDFFQSIPGFQECAEEDVETIFNIRIVSAFIYCMDRIRFSVIRTIAYPNGVWSQWIRINDILQYKKNGVRSWCCFFGILGSDPGATEDSLCRGAKMYADLLDLKVFV
ncbi:hypothetical protein TNCV_1512561 [Trichonephila clavipes]|nr:hypothetical protein TNCV_1512561 [Trichonephila clavipes]